MEEPLPKAEVMEQLKALKVNGEHHVFLLVEDGAGNIYMKQELPVHDQWVRYEIEVKKYTAGLVMQGPRKVVL